MNTQTKKQTTVIALIFALITSVVLATTCFISSAFADNTDAKTASTEAKLIATFDEDGTITIPSATIKNDTDYVVTIDEVSIASDYDFVKDWTSDAKGKTIQPGESLNVSWSATSTVPASFDGTTEVKVGTITYTYSYDTQDKKALPDNVSIEGTYTYTGSAIEPTIKGLDGLEEGKDYTVEYKNNTDADTATVVITGIGDYTGTKELTFTIKPQTLDMSSIKVADGTYTYNGKPQTPAIEGIPTGLQAGKDYDIAYTDNTNAGTAKATVTFKGNYEGSKTLEFAIGKASIDGATITTEELTYNGKEQTAKITKVTLADGTILKEGDYTVKNGNKGTKAGTYSSLTIEGAGNNYEGQAKGSFKINPQPVTITWTPKGEASYVYNGDPHAPTATVDTGVTGESFTVKLTYTSSSSTTPLSDAPSAVGTYTAIASLTAAAGTTATNYALPTEGLTKAFTITREQTNPVITFHGNGATESTATNGTVVDNEYTYTQTGTLGQGLKLTSNQFSKTDDNDVYGMLYWTTDREGNGTKYRDRANVEADDDLLAGGPVDLYAQWETKGLDNYWIAASKKIASSTSDPANNVYYTNPETSVVRTQSQIDEDMKVLHGTLAANSLGEGKDEVAKLYQSWSDSDEYHLYTKWNTATGESEKAVTTGDNAYVEFRIIQVGEHLNVTGDDTSGDGSAVTFMATHSLPTNKAMNSSRNNTTGWSDSAMRATMNEDGGYVMTGLSDLANATTTDGTKTVLSVKKMQATYNSEKSEWNHTASLTEKADTFWLLSYNELAGQTTLSPLKNEGSQYDWCATRVTNTTGSNTAIKGMFKTRSDSNPADCVAPATFWWFRSPYEFDKASFGYVNTSGLPYFSYGANSTLGVVPAFCF